MIQILPFLLLLISGAVAIAFNLSKFSLYGCFCAIVLFFINIFEKTEAWRIKLLHINSIHFELSTSCNKIESLVCISFCVILFCLHFARRIERQYEAKLNKIFGMLNILAFFICCAVCATNFFQFFIAIEASGVMAMMLSGMWHESKPAHSIKTFFFNQISCILFLVAVSMIAVSCQSLEFKVIEDIVVKHGSLVGLRAPALLLFVSCLFKCAQFPFFNWPLELTKAHPLVIIFQNLCLMTLALIFITKCGVVFEAFQDIQQYMTYFGLATFFCASFSSLFYHNIKKIMTCSAISTISVMLVLCGFGEYSLGLFFCLCQMFAQSFLFLSFFYLMHALSNEQNVLKMGGVAKLIPNISILVWLSFLATAGFPFFINFIAKASISNFLYSFASKKFFVFFIITNIISIIAIFKTIMMGIYGKAHANEATLSRVSKHNTNSIAPAWILVFSAIFFSFLFWNIYENGELHFGHLCAHGHITLHYFFECATAILQILLAIGLGLLFIRQKNHKNKIVKILHYIFHCDQLYLSIFEHIKNFTKNCLHNITHFQQKLQKSSATLFMRLMRKMQKNDIDTKSFYKFSNIAALLLVLVFAVFSILVGGK